VQVLEAEVQQADTLLSLLIFRVGADIGYLVKSTVTGMPGLSLPSGLASESSKA
jgi:hypothetical protein